MGNPSPAYIHDSMWWLWEQLHALEPDTQLGGIYARKSGYHNTGSDNEARWPGNYSIRDAADRRGEHWRTKASAIDWTFPSAQRGDYSRIAKYHARLINAGKARDPRLSGWREAYGQADADRQVEGWDFRYNKAVTSDDSHLWHIHLSESREHIGSKVNKEALLSVLKGEPLADWQARTNPPKPAPAFPPWPGRHLSYRNGRTTIGRDVRTWQARMRQRGWRIDVDGQYGPKSAEVARKFQREKHLQVDGIVGPKTWAAAWTAPIT